MVSCCTLIQVFRWWTPNSVAGTNLSHLNNFCTSLCGNWGVPDADSALRRAMGLNNFTHTMWLTGKLMLQSELLHWHWLGWGPCHRHGGNRVWLYFLRFRKLLAAYMRTLCFSSDSPLEGCWALGVTKSSAVCASFCESLPEPHPTRNRWGGVQISFRTHLWEIPQVFNFAQSQSFISFNSISWQLIRKALQNNLYTELSIKILKDI